MPSSHEATTVAQQTPEATRRTELAFCVFAKAPRHGQVKTRLARKLGDDIATRIASAFLDDTWKRTRSFARSSPNSGALLAIDGNAECCNSTEPSDEICTQGSGDLGARMERVLRRALEGSHAAIALGTDSPGLPLEFLRQAQAALLHADAVLGPSADGGFYLLALKHCPEGLLAELPWSASDTCEQTLRRLRGAGMHVAVIDSWFDVDEVDDLRQLTRLIDAGLIEEPRARELLSDVSLEGTEPFTQDDGLAKAPRISVIIPTLNEKTRIDARLRELAKMRAVTEVFVVDGDSNDGTAERARQWPNVRVLHSERGRAKQMNAGARYATGDVLLFLHADVELPENAADCIAEVMRTSAIAGCFKTHTVDDSARRRSAPWLRMADARSLYSGLPYGDQAIFVRAETFREIGGYPMQPLMEDLEFSRRLRRAGPIRKARASVRVSGRRFLARPVYYTFVVNVFPLLYALGVPPKTLAKLYRDPR